MIAYYGGQFKMPTKGKDRSLILFHFAINDVWVTANNEFFLVVLAEINVRNIFGQGNLTKVVPSKKETPITRTTASIKTEIPPSPFPNTNHRQTWEYFPPKQRNDQKERFLWGIIELHFTECIFNLPLNNDMELLKSYSQTYLFICHCKKARLKHASGGQGVF